MATILPLFFFFGFLLRTYGQHTSISDYVLFGGKPFAGQCVPNSPGFAVQVASNVSIQGGNTGSYSLVNAGSNNSFTGSIFSGGSIVLGSSNYVTGRVTAANTTGQAGNIFSAGSSGKFGGNIDVNGNITIGNSMVSGIVTHPLNTVYKGPVPGGGEVKGPTMLPVLPDMPPVTTFPAAGSGKVNATQLAPGAYGDLVITGNKTITFSGTGVYVFNSIKSTGNGNAFVFDFKGSSSGTIKIYVYASVYLDKSQASIINGGDAGRILTEVHGKGVDDDKTYSFGIGSSTSGSNAKWLGSVWVPYSGIHIGSGTGKVDVVGALWSGTQVNVESNVGLVFAPFIFCTPATANAGPDKPLDFGNATMLTGTSSTPGATYNWTSTNGGTITPPPNTAQITVTTAGTYILTVSAPGYCPVSDTAVVTGKVSSLIGSELESIVQNYTPNSPPSPFFTISNNSIFIDVITKEGQYNSVLTQITGPGYGMTNVFSNGSSNYIITGLFPISNLRLLNNLPNIVYVRPHYNAINNTGGLTHTMGDSSVRAQLVRSGYGLTGAGIRVGVISDSYNTITSAGTNPVSNTAAQDVLNGDLPGPGNPDGQFTPVHVLKDYPFPSTDEGRGMLQIVHDIAPGAELYFRTGFISPGDFATGIQELTAAGCKIIADDVTFITEPFLTDGVVARAVNQAAAAGTSYFSAAGNFGNKSYENTYNPVPAPGGLPGTAHNFGGGDVFQSVTLPPGDYTIVLQWLDDIYSLGQTATGGTKNDLDIYLTPNTDGTALFGFNRNNTNGDPIEVLPFTLTSTVNTNILITNNTVGSNPGRFKYVVYRGNIVFNEYATGMATVTGQANAAGSITIGAARFDKVPPFPGPFNTESFSSLGGTMVDGIVRNKPDFVGPDGVNTTVNLGVDYDHDSYSNFFGTSAATPHAAAVAALIMEGRQKFTGIATTSPAELRSILQSSATDMNAPGFDFSSGYGFINADAAMRTIAKPDPSLIKLVVPANITPGPAAFTLTVTGTNFSSTSVVKFRDQSLTTTVVNTTTATATIPAFTGDPIVSVYTPPTNTGGIDGGTSDTLRFFNIPKKEIKIVADKKTKKYAETLPAFTATVLVDGDSLQHTNLTLAQLGLDQVTFQTVAVAGSSTGTYAVTPVRTFDKTLPADQGFLELYNYIPVPGTLTIDKLPVTITAKDVTVTYGSKIPDAAFTYNFDGSKIPDATALANNLQLDHQSQLAKDSRGNDILGLVNSQAVTIVNGQAIPIVNGQAITIVNGQAVTIVNGQAVPIVNSQAITIVNAQQSTVMVNGQALTIVNGQAIPIVNQLTDPQVQGLSFLATTPSLANARQLGNQALVNGVYKKDSSLVVDITQESVLGFGTNSAQTNMQRSLNNIDSKGLVDVQSFTNGQAITIVNSQAITIVNGQAIPIINSQAITIVNSQAVTIVNGQAVTIVNGQAVTIVNGQAIPIVNAQNKTAVIIDSSEIGHGLSPLKSLNMLTGLDAGNQYILPGSLQNDNLQITYVSGKLTILPAPVVITPADGLTKIYGMPDPVIPFTNNAGLGATNFTGKLSHADGNAAGTYPYTLGTLSAGPNYSLSLTTVSPIPFFVITRKTITITASAGQQKTYGDADPLFTFTNDGAIDNFTGALSRESGENAGSYAFTLGTLSAGPNYLLALSALSPVPVFSINKKLVTVIPDASQSKYYGSPDPVFTFTNDAGVTGFTGALGRQSGEDAGSYPFVSGNLGAGDNYTLVLSGQSPLFTINKKTVNISVNGGHGKVYGDADPVIGFSNDAGISSFTGALSRTPGEMAGSYGYVAGNLSAGTNYLLVLTGSSQFTITKASLQINVNNASIFRGSSLPAFSAVVTGLKFSDNPAIVYQLSPAYTGAAGQYSIIATVPDFAQVGNYTITVRPGILYVNPYGGNAEDLKLSLSCVTVIASPAPGQYKYVARFRCNNQNSTVVNIPAGTSNVVNTVSGGSFDASGLPTVFPPGYTTFDLPFNGSKVTWTLKSYDVSSLITASISASSSSAKCSSNSSSRLVGGSEAETDLTVAGEETLPVIKTNVYPNPATLRVVISTAADPLSEKDIQLFNINGVSCPVKFVRRISPYSIELDVSGLRSGFYLIRAKTGAVYRTFRFVKE